MFNPRLEAEKLGVPVASVSAGDGLRFVCKQSAETIEIGIYGEVGDDGWGGGVSADEVAATLSESPTSAVNVTLNSPGGLAFDGVSIYNQLISHQGHVTTTISGLAYSAASVIFMAGDTRKVHPSSSFGIHRASGGGYGDQFLMMAVAEFLDQLDSAMIDLYSERSGQSAEQVTQWIDGKTKGTNMGTMFSGQESLDGGFATELIAGTTNKSPAEPVAAVAAGEGIMQMIASRRKIADFYK